jgi:hypothetical protein
MAAAGDLINLARKHLRSSGLLADDDPTLSIAASHDAARQAVTAHLRAAGFRVANEAGAHRLVIEYAKIALAGVVNDEDLAALDELRRDRHTAEYGDFASQAITPQQARDAIELAARIVDTVAATLARQHQSRP